MNKKDLFFLQQVEQILFTLKKQYNAKNGEELEKKLMRKAKRASKQLEVQDQLEFLSFIKQVLDAYNFAAKKHAKQVRANGEPYMTHPLHVALNEIFYQKHLTNSYIESPIIAALLHDTIEDTPTTYSEITSRFGEYMTKLVDNLSSNPEWNKWKQSKQLSSTEKGLLQFFKASKDPKSLRVKYNDRLHNLETLKHLPAKKRYQKVVDTFESGFLQYAKKEHMYFFLIQLYIAIKAYVTDEAIAEYADDAEYILRQRKKAISSISKILKKYEQFIKKQQKQSKKL